MQHERRKAAPASHGVLRLQLDDGQRATLDDLAHFGWTLRFIRRPLFQPPIPFVFAGQRHGVLEPDGRVNQMHRHRIRAGQ